MRNSNYEKLEENSFQLRSACFKRTLEEEKYQNVYETPGIKYSIFKD